MFSSGKNPNTYSSSAGVDPYFNKTILLIHADGTNGGGNINYLDSSIYNATLTRGATGSNAQGSFSPYSPAGWSMWFNGTTDYLSLVNTTSITLGTGDFTIEFWVYPTASVTNARQDWIDFNDGVTNNTRLLIYFDGTNIIYYGLGAARITGSAPIWNTWQHIAVVRISSVTKLYINGTQSGSNYSDTGNYGALPMYVGRDIGGTTYVTGFMSNIRVVKGLGVYTGNFTVPTSKLNTTQSSGTNIAAITGSYTSVLLNSNRWYDMSINDNRVVSNGTPWIVPLSPFAPTQAYRPSAHGGSMYSSIAADYLGSTVATIANTQTQYLLGGDDFTIECWFYALTSTLTAQQYFFSNYSGDTNNKGFRIAVYGGGAGAYVTYGATATTVATYAITRPIYMNSWTHIAVSRQSNMLRIFQNGQLVSSQYDNTSYNIPAFTLGNMIYSRATLLKGYTSDFRMTKSALYTTDFQVPALAQSPVTNTNTVVNTDLYVAKFNPTAVGSGTPGSMYFSWTNTGTGSPNITVTATFCIEFWINFNTLPDGNNALLGRYGVANAGFISISYNQISWGNAGYYSFSTPANRFVFTTNRWYHIAFMGSTYNYVAVDGDVYNSNDAGGSGSGYTHSGSWDFGNNAFSNFDAYVRDFRFTTGSIVYSTTNFTRPSAPLGFSPAGTTQLLTLNNSVLTDTTGTSTSLAAIGTSTSSFLLNNLGGTTNTIYYNNQPTVAMLSFNNASIYDSTGKNVLFLGTAGVNQVTLYNTPVKFGTGSFYGGGTYFTRIPDSPIWDFGSDEFMIDFWIYLNANTANYTIISKKATAAGFGPFQINTNTTGKVVVQLSTGGTAVTQTLTSTTTVSATTWTYIAVYKYFDGTNYKVVCSINGADGGGALSGAGNLNLVRNAIDVTIGNQSIVASQQLNGYLDDFRVTRSVRGYTTSSFPPVPTKTFADQ